MSKGAKIFVWILIAMVIILAIYIVASRKPATKPPVDITNNGVIDGGTSDGNSGVDITQPPVKVEDTQFVLNDKIYAGENVLNAYKSCAPSGTNIGATFNKGELVGTFLRSEGSCIVVQVEVGYTYWFFGQRFVPLSSENYYLLFNANIYKK